MASRARVPPASNNTDAPVPLEHRNLLQELATPTGDHEIDIVAIHGINGDSIQSWRHRDTLFFWLKDYLPGQFPKARVLTYGYSASVWCTEGTPSIEGESGRLLASLRVKLEAYPDRLVVFICHSMGGILLKNAMVKANNEQQEYRFLLNQPKVVMFMATPHVGSKIATFLDLLIRIPIVIDKKNVKKLRSHSEWLALLSDRFEERKGEFTAILSLYETKYYGTLGRVVVDEHSASLPGAPKLAIDKDHSSICKFKSESDPEFQLIASALERMIREGQHAIRMRKTSGNATHVGTRGPQLQQGPNFQARAPNAREMQPRRPPFLTPPPNSRRQLTNALDWDTPAPTSPQVSLRSFMPSTPTTPTTPSSTPLSDMTTMLRKARESFLGCRYDTSYHHYNVLFDKVRTSLRGGSGGVTMDQVGNGGPQEGESSHTRAQLVVMLFTAILGMARCCVRLALVEQNARQRVDDVTNRVGGDNMERVVDESVACEKTDVQYAHTLLDKAQRLFDNCCIPSPSPRTPSLPYTGNEDPSNSDQDVERRMAPRVELGREDARGLWVEMQQVENDVNALDSCQQVVSLVGLAVEVKRRFRRSGFPATST